MSRLLSKERVRDLLLGLALLCATLALMLYPQPSMEAAKSGLALCYNVIIPSLFPFFVLSSLVVELGLAGYLGKQLIANGHDRNELLNTTSGVLTEAQLEGMSEWEVTDVIPMQKWLNRLEKYNVFFSAPLDIDFMMLEQMEAEYKNTLGATEGPRVDIVQDKIKQRTFISTIEDSGKRTKND